MLLGPPISSRHDTLCPHTSPFQSPASVYTGLGYGKGYAEATDNLGVIAESLVTLRGERSLYFGAEGANAKNVGSDFFARYYYRDATRRLDGMSRDAVAKIGRAP